MRIARIMAEERRGSWTGLPMWKFTRSSGATDDAAVASLISETFAARVGRRRKLLDYLKNKKIENYRMLIKELNLRK